MQKQIDELKERLHAFEEVLKHKAGVAYVDAHVEPLKRNLTALEKRMDDILDATIKAITTNSVEGLKLLRLR